MAKKAPSRKQINLARLALQHPTLPKGELVALGGYGEAVVNTPSKALESKGYLEALASFGLTEELISSSLVADIKKKPQKRVMELSLGADILGMKKRDAVPPGTTTNNFIQIVIKEPSKNGQPIGRTDS